MQDGRITHSLSNGPIVNPLFAHLAFNLLAAVVSSSHETRLKVRNGISCQCLPLLRITVPLQFDLLAFGVEYMILVLAKCAASNYAFLDQFQNYLVQYQDHELQVVLNSQFHHSVACISSIATDRG